MKSFALIILTVSLVSFMVQAQQDGYKRGVQVTPCSQAIPKGHQLNLDFGQLCFYEQANAKLSQSATDRVVYFGDSITQGWGTRIPGLNANETINRGIGGQTTAQMLVRFRADVINLRPRVVHIMAGTNDIAGNTGATSVQRIKDALSSMAELAHANGIRVVLASIPPAKKITWRPEVEPVAPIAEINQWLSRYAKTKGFVFVDYHSVLNDGSGGFIQNLATDGVHPNEAGYSRMIPLAADAIRRAVVSQRN